MSTDVMSLPSGTSNGDDSNDPRMANEMELRDLIYQSLERDGLIPRLKAQLRAAVFKTIEKSTGTTKSSHLPAQDGMNDRVCRALVLDWLKQSRFLYTEDVFKVETTGSNHSAPLTHSELLEQLHLKGTPNQSQSLLHTLLDQSSTRSPTSVTTLPDSIKRSIEEQFPSEKINDLIRLRDHFRSLFSSAFDSTVLDAYVNKTIPSTLTSFPKFEYEQICLKWMQACSNALTPRVVPAKPSTTTVPAPSAPSKNTVNPVPTVTQAQRAKSPPSSSSSASSSSSSSPVNQQRKPAFDFQLPTTNTAPKTVVKKAADVIPPPVLIDFDDHSNSEGEDDDEDTSASVFSKRNATPAELNKLKTIDSIIQGDVTPRTRTIISKPSNDRAKGFPIDYDDESISQSVSHSIVSSVDDITVDKASPSPSATLDYLDDFSNN